MLLLLLLVVVVNVVVVVVVVVVVTVHGCSCWYRSILSVKLTFIIHLLFVHVCHHTQKKNC